MQFLGSRMIDILRKMLKTDPGKSTIEIKDKCSECGCEVIIEITPTSGGFGLQGGTLCKCSSDAYFAKCPNCYNANSKTVDETPKVGVPRMEV